MLVREDAPLDPVDITGDSSDHLELQFARFSIGIDHLLKLPIIELLGEIRNTDSGTVGWTARYSNH
jgi:hypothetical protein